MVERARSLIILTEEETVMSLNLTNEETAIAPNLAMHISCHNYIAERVRSLSLTKNATCISLNINIEETVISLTLWFVFSTGHR